MFKCQLEKIDWKKGHAAGLAGKLSVPPRDVDGLSWMSGYIEGRAERGKTERQKNTTITTKCANAHENTPCA